MQKQSEGPLPVIAGILMTLVCLGMAGGTVWLGIRFFPHRPAIPDNLPTTLEQAKAQCANGECIEGCVLHAAQAVGYEKYPPVMDSGYESELVSYKVEDDQLLEPAYPPITAKLIVYQRNSKAHHRIWDYFIGMVPAGRRPGLAEFVIYSGGESGAQFAPTDQGGWSLHVNVLDATDPEFLTHALVHEFGHFLTLNPTQQEPVAAERGCKQEALYGCPSPDSYVNEFFEKFWRGLYPEWMGMKGASNYQAILAHFYAEHNDQFVSEYAASQPLEDIAETWTAFILQPRPSGDLIADQKVLSLYDYPELVELRYEMITRICTYAPPPNR